MKKAFKKKEPNDIGIKSAKKPASPAQKATQFKEGNNLGGRPKGSRNKLGEAFISDLYADWSKHGAATLARVREEDPSTYVKVCSSIVPKDINLNNLADEAALEKFLGQYSDDELRSLLAGIAAAGAANKAKAAKEPTGKQPNSVH